MSFRPLTHRAFQWFADATPIPVAVIGLIITLAFGALGFWLTWIEGIVDDVVAGRAPSLAVRAIVTLYLTVGYLPLALYYLVDWTFKNLETTKDRFALEGNLATFPRRAANLAGVMGIVAVYFMFLHEPNDPLLLMQPTRWTSNFVLPLLGLPLMGWFNFRFAFFLAWSAIVVSRSAQFVDGIDLLDASSIKPYAQHGVRSSLLAIIGLSISANLWLDPESPLIGAAITVIMFVCAAAVALLLPTWGIHQRLKSLKEQELVQVRVAIAGRRNRQTRSLEDAQQLHTDLVLERRLMDVSAWPFDAGSYGRVALYVFLGLGSWVGAALVERGLESLAG